MILGHSTLLQYLMVHLVFGILFLETMELLLLAIIKIADPLLISISILILGISSLEHDLIPLQMRLRIKIR